MLQVSDAYKELVKSNIRPKCEPIIKVSGKDNNGDDIELIWRAKNIKDLTYKRSIDPVGRELPYMELTWTEVYTGKLNAESYPEKYNNIVKYMQVELSFVQDLGFYNTWKTIFNGGLKWKDLFSKTWKQLKNDVSQEKIKMPTLFLNARPIIDGQTITWTAKDTLSLLSEEEMVFLFDGKTYAEVQPKKYINPIIYILINLRASFFNSKNIFDSVTKSIDVLKNTDYGFFNEQLIFEGKIKNSIMQYLNLKNLHINFKDDYFFVTELEKKSPVSDFSQNVMYKQPEITSVGNISDYTFAYNFYELRYDDMYDVSPTKIISINQNATLYDYIFKDLGVLYSEDLGEIYLAEVIKYTIIESPNYSQVEKVVPLNKKKINSTIKNETVGEAYNENNPMNVYNGEREELISRFEFLKEYFNDNCKLLSFESLPDLSVETGDVVSVETNLYNKEEKITKNAVVVEMEIKYNGTLKEKLKCHEVIYDN